MSYPTPSAVLFYAMLCYVTSTILEPHFSVEYALCAVSYVPQHTHHIHNAYNPQSICSILRTACHVLHTKDLVVPVSEVAVPSRARRSVDLQQTPSHVCTYSAHEFATSVGTIRIHIHM